MDRSPATRDPTSSKVYNSLSGRISSKPSSSTTSSKAAVSPKTSSGILKAAKPTRNIFDAWNTTSKGHQHAEHRLSGSTGWRDSRILKLGEQFRDGHRGGRRIRDLVGAGSEAFGDEGRLEDGSWSVGARVLREGDQRSLWEVLENGSRKRKLDGLITEKSIDEVDRRRRRKHNGGERRTEKEKEDKNDTTSETPVSQKNWGVVYDVDEDLDFVMPSYQPQSRHQENLEQDEEQEQKVPPLQQQLSDSTGTDTISPTTSPPSNKAQIFKQLVFYINGSTYPYISDHKLKRVLTEHGGSLSLALGRKSVTHVIIGTPNANGGGAGGGLAGGKIQKEIANVRGRGIKFVTVEWLIESVRAGKRLPEAKYAACLKLASKKQSSVLDVFGGREEAS